MKKVSELTLDEISTELKGYQKEDLEQSNRIYELKQHQAVLTREKCKSDIGRCFKTKDEFIYIKIIDAPHLEIHEHGANTINEYQYPALWIKINDSKSPFIYQTVFSGIWGKGNYPYSQYTEITKEEFNEKFSAICERWKNTVSNI